MGLNKPFVKYCPRCEAPVADWEYDDNGHMVVHLVELHECRLIDLSLGRPPREHMSDRWDPDDRVWIVRGHRLKE
jgi:hypothetical protein